jgi:hypothetical protein
MLESVTDFTSTRSKERRNGGRWLIFASSHLNIDPVSFCILDPPVFLAMDRESDSEVRG